MFTIDEMMSLVLWVIMVQIAVVSCSLLFILLGSLKCSAEKTTCQTLPVVGLSLILLAGLCDAIQDDISKKTTWLGNAEFTGKVICRILT